MLFSTAVSAGTVTDEVNFFLGTEGAFCFVGEFGCFNKTPHPIALAWLEDQLRYFKQRNWGWALWLMNGSFGFIDSERDDVEYEDFHGHKLDRKMLELLQKY